MTASHSLTCSVLMGSCGGEKKSSSRQEVMRFMFWDKEKKETAKVVKAARLNKQRKERHLQKIKKNTKHKEGMRETKINS